MKFSISNIAWDAKDDEVIYDYLSHRNFAGLEIAPTRLWNAPYENSERAKKWAEELYNRYKLEISSMQSIWYGRTEAICNSEEEKNALLDYTFKAILFAEKIKCKNLVFGCPKNRCIQSDKDVTIIADFLAEVGQYANKHNTCFSIEPNPTIYGTNFVNTTRQAINLCRQINNPGIRVNYDFGTVIENNEDIKECLDNIDIVNHIHISEPYLVKINKRDAHMDLIKELEVLDYKGFVSIEMKKQDTIQDVCEIIDYLGSML